jgi:Sulfatase
MVIKRIVLWLTVGSAFAVAFASATTRELGAQSRPNIVLIFPDNLGWGEVGVYGSVRGDVTPRLDRLAAQGIRLNNFNVDVNAVNSDGRTALDAARALKFEHVVTFLTDRGARAGR